MKQKCNLKLTFRTVSRAVLVFVALMAVQAMSAQNKNITLNVKDVPLESVLNTLKSDYGYSFVMITNDIDINRKITLNIKDSPIESVLSALFEGRNVKFEVDDNKILISRAAAAPKLSAEKEPRTVTGTVTDVKGDPVVGATVWVPGTSVGASTDMDGKYSIKVDGEVDLKCQCLGYKSITRHVVSSNGKIDFLLEEENTSLDEVVVIGYGVQNKRDVTTSISSIKATDIANNPATDFRQTLVAKMPGVSVFQTGGDPSGSGVSIRVRGISSATAGNDPLYVIDGVPTDSRSFANISSSDISSVEVLKDASSAAIYGSRGSGGVILITTKTGTSDRPVISYNTYFGVSTVSKKIDMMNAYEWAQANKDGHDGSYLTDNPDASVDDPNSMRTGETYWQVPSEVLLYLNDTSGDLTDTDWQDAIFRTALSNSHSLSVSGKSKYLKYYTSANYLWREGTIIDSDFTRYGLRINLDGNRGKLKWGLNFSPAYSKQHYVNADSQYTSDGVVASALMTAPIFPVYNEDGSYNWDMNGLLNLEETNTQYNNTLNAVALANEIDDVREKMSMLGNAYASYEIIKGLEYKFSMGGDFYSYNRDYYRPSYLEKRGNSTHGQASSATGEHDANSYYNWNVENQLSYNVSFGDNNISAVAVYQAQKNVNESSSIVGTGYADDRIRTIAGATEIETSGTSSNITGWTMASWLTRAQYSYKGKYMLSAAIRGDGCSRFGKNNRWGYFPSASLGWRITDEDFMKQQTWLNDLKFRLSYGQTGNSQIGNYDYLATLSTLTYISGAGDGDIVTGYYPSAAENDDLGWEKNSQVDIGFDAVAFKGLLGLSFDYYYSVTTDMLFDVPIAQTSGMSTATMNIGSMQNQGIEINLTSSYNWGKFGYNFSGNFALNRNMVLHLGDNDAPIIKKSSYSGAYYITEVGKPVGCYYLLVQDGIFHNQEELDSYPHFSNTHVGDFRFVDANGNGIMEEDDDRVICGNYMPDFTYGFSGGVKLRQLGFERLVRRFIRQRNIESGTPLPLQYGRFV
jgi:TonB-linked SusC/RagA family outer membrane protein